MIPTQPLPLPFFIATLPLPPSINASYKNLAVEGRKGRAATHDLRQFKRDASLMLTQGVVEMRTLDRVRSSRVKVPLALDLTFYLLTLWRRDLDGGIKAVQDIVFSHLGMNDTLIVELHARKRVDASNPRVEIAVSCAPHHNGID